MASVHEFICDRCDKKVKAIWIDNKWCFPLEWVEMVTLGGSSVGHFCGNCRSVNLPQIQTPQEPKK